MTDKREFDRMKSIERKWYFRLLIRLILWELLVLGCWIFYHLYTDTPIFHPSSIFWTLCMILPLLFSKFRDPIFFSPHWEGRIRSIRMENRIVQVATRKVNAALKDVVVMSVRINDGSTREILFVTNEQIAISAYYKVDDEIIKLRGLFYPVKVNDTNQEMSFCPRCGHVTVRENKRCHWCKFSMIR